MFDSNDDLTLARACMSREERVVASAIAVSLAINDEFDVLRDGLAGTNTAALLGVLVQDVSELLEKGK